MPSFHKLFRKYLDQRNLTVYRLSKELQIERSTLYQVQSGARLPTVQMLHRLSNHLRLSPQEEQHWLEAWKRERLGPGHYQLRQRVEICIQTLEQYTKRRSANQDIRRRVTLDIPKERSVALEGRREIMGLLQDLIEVQLSRRGGGPVDIHLPFQALAECRGCLERPALPQDGPRMRQIFSLSLPEQIQPEDLSSMVDILNDVLANFFAPGGYARYIPYFYYDNAVPENGLSNLFPYYVITDRHMVLLGEALDQAIVLSDPVAVDAFRQRFQANLSQARPLFRQYDSPIQALEDIQPMALQSTHEAFSTHFFRQPCFVMLADPDIVGRCIRPDFPNREQVLRAVVAHYIEGCAFGPEDYNFFTRSGIADFLADGIMREFPSSLLLPLCLEDRLTLIRRLRDRAGEEGANIYCVDERLVSVPANVNIDICFGRLMIFSRSQPEDLSYLVVSEPTVIRCFLDYFRALPCAPGVSDRAETVAILDQLLAPYAQTVLEQ